MIWLSGGAWNNKQAATIDGEIQKLRQQEVNIYPFGIGRPINEEQLRSVASKMENVFVPTSYGNLEREKGPLIKAMVFGGEYTNKYL